MRGTCNTGALIVRLEISIENSGLKLCASHRSIPAHVVAPNGARPSHRIQSQTCVFRKLLWLFHYFECVSRIRRHCPVRPPTRLRPTARNNDDWIHPVLWIMTLFIIGKGNGSALLRRPAITWTHNKLKSIGANATTLSRTWIKSEYFLSKCT